MLTSATALLLTGCGNDSSDKASERSSTTQAASDQTAVPGSSPSTKSQTPRKAADGRNLEACLDSKCEVEVRTGDTIRFENEPELDEITVVSISDGQMSFGPSTDGIVRAVIQVSGPNDPVTLNGVNVKAVQIDDKRAIIHIS